MFTGMLYHGNFAWEMWFTILGMNQKGLVEFKADGNGKYSVWATTAGARALKGG